MSLGDRFPVDPLSDNDWADVERAVAAELDAVTPAASAAPARRGPWALAALGVIAAAAVVALAISWHGEPSSLSSTRLAARTEPVRAVVGDASYELSAGAELVVVEHPEAGTIATLERGEARFAVPPRAGRAPFVVEAGGVRVEVVWTRFRVARHAARVGVAVERGVVRVSHDGASTLLERGERWSTEREDPPPAPPVERAEMTVPEARAGTAPSASARPTSRRDAGDTRALFDRAAALERDDPARAIALYARVVSRRDGWAPAALFAQARLEHERGNHDRARRLCRLYLERHPRGINAEDARTLLAR